MKKRKKGHHFKTPATGHWQSTSPRAVELEPEDLAAYVRQAERNVLPKIKEMQLGPGTAQLLLALHTHMLVTGDPHVTPESMMAAGNSVLALWKAGYYTPGPEYPFTLEETLREIRGRLHAKGDYTTSILPFSPTKANVPRGLGCLSGGIAKHPVTNLWQVWMIVDGPCTCIGAYRDEENAQKTLEEIVIAIRSGSTLAESAALYRQAQSRAEGETKQLPYDMQVYLSEHLDDFTIEL